MNPDLYLLATIARHRIPDSGLSTAHRIRQRLRPLLRAWAGPHLESVDIIGSFAKGTAIRNPSLLPSDYDIDLFLSLSPSAPVRLHEFHDSLAAHLTCFQPQPRNVALRILVDGLKVDLVPARRRLNTPGYTLWQRRFSRRLHTDITRQIHYVRSSGLTDEILALKIWRRRHALRSITNSSASSIS
jgi:hypothetical protein